MRNILFTLVLSLFGSAVALAGIAPDLLHVFQTPSGDQLVPTLVVLSNRVDGPAQADALKKRGLSLAECHQLLLDSLKARASATQSTVRKSLEVLSGNGMAANVRTLWLGNIVAVNLSRTGAQLIAGMDEVAEVALDALVTLRGPVDSEIAPSAAGGASSALRLCGAPEAWGAGLHGENRLVCVIADGVAAGHEALESAWQGNGGNLAASWWEPGSGHAPGWCGDVGTFMAGLSCGSFSGDTIGMAPACHWITAKLFCGETRLSDVISACQWAADPDGNSFSMDDVPDVIVSSWSLDSPCASPEGIWWSALDNLEALGPVVIFSASDNGSRGTASVESPDSRTGNGVGFCVGNAMWRDGRWQVNPSSGRGPSPCDRATVKPDLTATGTAVRSCSQDGYALLTGNCASAALAAGTVALIRQADPDLRAGDIKQILLSSATDLGSPREDNDFGWGLLNAGAAVKLALSSGRTGTIRGVVRYGGEGLPAAHVVLSGLHGDLSAMTNSSGLFRFEHVLADNRHVLRVGRFGYQLWSRGDSVDVKPDGTRDFTVDMHRGFGDDLEFDQGWSLGVEGENASDGVWSRAHPAPGPVGATPPSAVSGSYCFVTGNGGSSDGQSANADVDGGRTTLRSPEFNLSGIRDPILHFSYWYSNDRGANPGGDFFRAQVSDDGGENWTNLINTSSSSRGWRNASFKLNDFVKPTARMLLQFVAEDSPPASLVEAAIDDISISGTPDVPEPPTNLTMDVQFDQVILKWSSSAGATGYRVYLSDNPNHIVAPEFYYAMTAETTMTVPMSAIHYNQFYFQVTGTR